MIKKEKLCILLIYFGYRYEVNLHTFNFQDVNYNGLIGFLWRLLITYKRARTLTIHIHLHSSLYFPETSTLNLTQTEI